MTGVVVVCVLSLFGMLIIVYSALQYKRYLIFRYEVFELREDLIKLGLKAQIPKGIVQRNYNSMNYVARYVSHLPIFVFLGFAKAAAEIGVSADSIEFEQELRDATDEHREWYFRFNLLLIRAVNSYAPLRILQAVVSTRRVPIIGLSASIGLEILAMLVFICWILPRARSLRNHPLTRLKWTVAEVRKQNYELIELKKNADEINREMKLAYHS